MNSSSARPVAVPDARPASQCPVSLRRNSPGSAAARFADAVAHGWATDRCSFAAVPRRLAGCAEPEPMPAYVSRFGEICPAKPTHPNCYDPASTATLQRGVARRLPFQGRSIFFQMSAIRLFDDDEATCRQPLRHQISPRYWPGFPSGSFPPKSYRLVYPRPLSVCCRC